MLYLALKRSKDAGSLRLFLDKPGSPEEITEEAFLAGKHSEIYIRAPGQPLVKADVRSVKQTPRAASHQLLEGKIFTQFTNNGKNTHSSEIELDVAVTLLKTTIKSRYKEQTEEDDNNFWKNPVNQTTQMKFAEEGVKEKKYGGNITYEELEKHNSPQDAWIAVDGKVYDVTKYATIHPGGKKINLGFGKDATALYRRLGLAGKYHSWVNIDSIIGKCYIGLLE